MNAKTLKVVLIRPSKYDDDGYIVRFWRGAVASNSLWCLQSLTEEVARRRELGPDVNIEVYTHDDVVERIPYARIARWNRRPGVQALVGLVGVQTNMFARAADIALAMRARGIPVLIGGFHVSGVLAQYGAPTPELQEMLDAGVSLVKGEAEAPGALRDIYADALAGRLRPIYDITELPDLEQAPVPLPDIHKSRRFWGGATGTIDTSRGCPFNCSFCTVINVQGRRMRHRSAACVAKAIETNYHRGISRYFFTDDNFSRNPVRDDILDALIALRKRGIAISFMMQVDAQAHAIPGFCEKAAAAGCAQVFVGVESMNADNLEAMGKTQNRIGEYGEMAQAWRRHAVLVNAGYILGLPFDTTTSVRADVERLAHEVGVELASFFMLTPLPGSRDEHAMRGRGDALDADTNNYDGLHETFPHPNFEPGQWRAAYDDAMKRFYSKEKIVATLLRMPRERYWAMFGFYIWQRYCAVEGQHAMLTGVIRLKRRRERRRGMALESRAAYGLRRVKDLSRLMRVYAGLFVEFQEIWLLTRNANDQKAQILAELYNRWMALRGRLDSCDAPNLPESLDEARAALAAASGKIHELCACESVRGRERPKLNKTARDIDDYLRSLDTAPMPLWKRVVDAEGFIGGRVVAGFEETACRLVAQRRRFNAYRRDVFERLKTGHVLTMNVSRLPVAIAFEMALACRFGLALLGKL